MSIFCLKFDSRKSLKAPYDLIRRKSVTGMRSQSSSDHNLVLAHPFVLLPCTPGNLFPVDKTNFRDLSGVPFELVFGGRASPSWFSVSEYKDVGLDGRDCCCG